MNITSTDREQRVVVMALSASATSALRLGGFDVVSVSDVAALVAAIQSGAAAVVCGPGEGLEALAQARAAAPHVQRLLAHGGDVDLATVTRAVNEIEVHRIVDLGGGTDALVAAVGLASARHDRLVEDARLLELADRRTDQLRELAQSLEERVNERTQLLIRAKRTWEQTFDAISDPLSIVDPSYTVVRTNLAWAAAAGEDVRRIQGRPCHEVLFGGRTPCTGCPMQRTLETGRMATSEVRASAGDRTFRVTTFPMTSRTDRDGAPLDRVVCHYRDVTDDKALQRLLLQTEKMAAVGQLAGGIAHEINNPLGAILAFAQLGLRDVDPTSETFEFLKEIEEGALRCKDIVQNLLTFSRSSRAEEVSEVDLNSVVDRACVLLGHEFHVGRWQLETRCRTGLPLVRGNRNRLQQVAVNLLTNAKAAMPNGGRVVVATEVDEQGRVVLSVTDEGTGIPEHILPKIFEPFFTTKEEGKGTGLGLAVSYGIVKEHEGAIEVETEEGQGATFRVLLPAATAARGRGRSGGRRR
jgi:two-component system NtrC family sensor kinase